MTLIQLIFDLLIFLTDLTKGRCLSDFNWNSGACYKGKQWTEEWPSDAQVQNDIDNCQVSSFKRCFYLHFFDDLDYHALFLYIYELSITISSKLS